VLIDRGFKVFKGAEINCYCAFCRTPRKIYRKKTLSFVNFLQAALISSFLTWLFWQGLEPKGLLIFIACLSVIEMLILGRSRLAIDCPECGFDPYLYIKDQKRACDKVKEHLDLRKSDPDVWLAKRPPLMLPTQKPKPGTMLANSKYRKVKQSTRDFIA
jgi:hypothetical protein